MKETQPVMNRIEDYNKVLPVLELYTAVQSEGSRAGYPTIVIRTTGCTHRCYFGEGGWCDSWYTSIHPEKGTFTFNDIIKMYDENPHISEMMLTGGSPTMHAVLVNELTHFAHERNIYITIETEGSHFIATDYPINLISLSPKFTNSIPILGSITPQGKTADQKMINQHNKFRMNYKAMAQMIAYHDSFHIKPVLDKNLSIISEFEDFLTKLSQELKNLADPSNNDPIYYSGVDWLYYSEVNEIQTYLKLNTWMMPAGDTRAALTESYGPVMDYCRDNGYKFTPRPHVIAFNDQRGV
jgi:7-carboxy-7-deazaguanine synthase